MKKLFVFLTICQALVLMSCNVQKLTPEQQAALEEKNKDKIEMPDFMFTPTSLTPQFGISHNLVCMECSIKVTAKRIEANLPYLGHFYIRPTNLRWDVPINFISDKFVYAASYLPSEGEYRITLTPEDAGSVMNDNIVFNFWIKPDGTGMLKVKSDNRDEITYEGSIR